MRFNQFTKYRILSSRYTSGNIEELESVKAGAGMGAKGVHDVVTCAETGGGSSANSLLLDRGCILFASLACFV